MVSRIPAKLYVLGLLCIALMCFVYKGFEHYDRSSNSDHSNDIRVDYLLNQRMETLQSYDVNLPNESDVEGDRLDFLKERYGPIKFSSINSVNTALAADEKKRYDVCVKNAARDRGNNGSKFWPVEQIRRTHHTYLKHKDAILIEVGGNHGDDASEFVRLYNPRYVILEPLEEYANILKKKFNENPRVTVVNVGLGARNEILLVKIEGNNACATSKFSTAKGKTPLFITNATEFMLKLGVGLFDVDLMTMNCEGCEYEALEVLLSTNLIEHFRNIQFATHSTLAGIREPLGRYCAIQELLSRTHRPTYQYRFIWESWRRRDLP